MVAAAIVLGPWLSPYSPTRMQYSQLLRPPSWEHIFGTDSFGRDVFTRILYGARVSLVLQPDRSVDRRGDRHLGRAGGGPFWPLVGHAADAQ